MNEDSGHQDDNIEALKARNLALETSLRQATEAAEQRIISAELKSEALRAGIVDLDGLKLIDRSGICVDEDGEVHGASSSISRMRKEKPWLFGTRNSSSTAVPPASQTPQAKQATEMSLEEWRAARAELIRRR